MSLPFPAISTLIQQRPLIVKLVKRDILARNKGSALGVAWSLLSPLLMLLIYTVVFSEIFKMRWGGLEANKAMFAVMVFSGMLVLSFFSEVLNRAPTIILSNANFVKKVVFPLDVLNVVSVGAAFFQLLMSVGILLLAILVIQGHIAITVLYLPVVLVPLIIFSLGLSWLLAAIGVYFRDIGQIITAVTAVLMFLSPVFYPMSAVPDGLRSIILLNPLTFIIQQVRAVAIWGQQPDWAGWLIYMLIATLVMWLGYALFQNLRKGFADVI